MIRRMLIIGYKQPLAQELKRKWVSEGLCPYYAENLNKVAEELDGSQDYSLVLILDDVILMEAVRTVRRISICNTLKGSKRESQVSELCLGDTQSGIPVMAI